jgi:bacillopeptidase F (M6 metalloprotease family)
MNRFKKILACLCAGLLLAAGRGGAQTAFWSDNFETNAGSRWTTNGVWQVGSPTSGPGSAHAGAKCGGTGLTASAPANANARFICTNYFGATNLTVPAASFSPRLRFWQWFNFVNAAGYVELRAAGSTNWQAISATNLSFAGTANTGSGVWSEPSLDLSAFAGARVQIAFHFISGANYGSDPGWFVDDVAVVTNAPVFNNPESFEAGLGDWSVDAGTWEVGKPTSGPATNALGFRAHSGTNCAATVLAGNYGWNVDTRLISAPLAVPATGRPALRFWQWYSFINAQGFVEINNGSANTSYVTNTTITTNQFFSSLNTNLYQLSGAANAAYAAPLYWNQTIGGWTNATKAMGNVNDAIFQGGYFFEAGNAPLASVGGANVDYALDSVLPAPRSAAATNFLAWQGATWNSTADANDNPVGYFGTNYTFTYVTNTTVTGFQNGNWLAISPTNQSFGGGAVKSGGWTNASVDLSAYAGQTVKVAFHFQSGGSGYGSAAGWYVDDVSLATAPTLTVPASQTLFTGQTLTVTNFATNTFLTNATFTFALAVASTNAFITTNGVLTWTNIAARPGTNVLYVKVSDNSAPPLSATNNFSVIVVSPPAAPILTVANTLSNGQLFQFGFTSFSNLTWRIDASTNLVSWLPVFTNTAGAGGTLQFTDVLATNFPRRFYRAVFP